MGSSTPCCSATVGKVWSQCALFVLLCLVPAMVDRRMDIAQEVSCFLIFKTSLASEWCLNNVWSLFFFFFAIEPSVLSSSLRRHFELLGFSFLLDDLLVLNWRYALEARNVFARSTLSMCHWRGFAFSFDLSLSLSLSLSLFHTHGHTHTQTFIQSGAVKLVLWRHWVHLSYMHPVTSENQFHCTRLYLPPWCNALFLVAMFRESFAYSHTSCALLLFAGSVCHRHSAVLSWWLPWRLARACPASHHVRRDNVLGSGKLFVACSELWSRCKL